MKCIIKIKSRGSNHLRTYLGVRHGLFTRVNKQDALVVNLQDLHKTITDVHKDKSFLADVSTIIILEDDNE